MESECKVILDANVSIEAGDQMYTRPKTIQMTRPTLALMTFTLCLATGATVSFFSNAFLKDEGPEENSFDLHHRHTLRQVSNRRAAIHLVGEYNPTIKTSVKWMSQMDQSHSQGGLELKSNEILIPENGLYFVYSQVSFRVSCSSDADDITSNPMVHLTHTVKRWSSSFGSNNEMSYQTIMQSVRTACQTIASKDPYSVGSWFSAVYMGAVFNSGKGDRLKTVTEENMLEKLEDEPGKSYFGVFAL